MTLTQTKMQTRRHTALSKMILICVLFLVGVINGSNVSHSDEFDTSTTGKEIQKTHEVKRSAEGLSTLADEQVSLDRNLSSKINQAMSSMVNSYNKSVGDTVEMDCENEYSLNIFEIYPKASRHWIHNNFGFRFKGERMMYRFGLLTIQNIHKDDQGVYLCRIEYKPKQVKTVAFFTLEVTSNNVDVRVQETMTLKLRCHSAALGYLFPNAYRDWFVNGKLIQPSGKSSDNKTLAHLTSTDSFYNVSKNHQGNWQCIVTDPDNERQWTTSFYVVKVLDPPTKAERLVHMVMDNKIKSAFIFISMLAFCFVMCVGVLKKGKSMKENSEKEFDEFKTLFQETDLHTSQENERLLNDKDGNESFESV